MPRIAALLLHRHIMMLLQFLFLFSLDYPFLLYVWFSLLFHTFPSFCSFLTYPDMSCFFLFLPLPLLAFSLHLDTSFWVRFASFRHLPRASRKDMVIQKQRWEEKEQGEDQSRGRVRGQKMQMREEIAESRNPASFQWFVAPEGRKVGSLKQRARSHLAR